jgi:predicted nucleic acid-binding protein
MRAVIDSDVLIDFLQGDKRAKDEIQRYKPVCYSIISWMELMCGAENEQEKAGVKALLDSMQRVDLTPEVAQLAVDARKKLRLKLPDAVIWATAESLGCLLVTRNSKDFDKTDPMIRVPY